MAAELNRTALLGYRAMLSLTQQEMAKIADISKGGYSQKENGKTCFNELEMKRIQSKFKETFAGITVDDIFFKDYVNGLVTK